MDTNRETWLAPVWSHSPSHRLVGDGRTACGVKLQHYIPSNREERHKCKRCLPKPGSVGPFPAEPRAWKLWRLVDEFQKFNPAYDASTEWVALPDVFELQAKVERLRAENADLVAQNANVQALGRVHKMVTDERDALADALVKAAPFLCYVGRAWRSTFPGPTDDPMGVLREIEAALRKAGRL